MFEESIKELYNRFFNFPREAIIDDTQPHDKEIIMQIRVTYVFGLIAWLAIIILLRMFETDCIGLLILLIPLVVFFMGYYNADVVTLEIEKEMFRTNYLSAGLIVILPLLVWITDAQSKNKSKFIALLVLSVILTLLSMIDVWVSKREMSVYSHVRSILQTLSIAIIIYALYIFYLERCQHIIDGECVTSIPDKANIETAAVLATGAAVMGSQSSNPSGPPSSIPSSRPSSSPSTSSAIKATIIKNYHK